MIDLFQDILDIEDVQGVMFFSFKGNLIFKHFKSNMAAGLNDGDLITLIHVLENIQEAELVYDNGMIYTIRARTGYVLVIMGRFASIAMVRLNCGIILPTLPLTDKKPKGLRRFFGK